MHSLTKTQTKIIVYENINSHLNRALDFLPFR